MMVAGVILLLSVVIFEPMPRGNQCFDAWVTGYLRSAFSAHTYDGTPIMTEEPIIAASWDIPIDAHIWIDGLGTFRVADRGGGLGNGWPQSWLDVPVWTLAEAYALTGQRRACRLS